MNNKILICYFVKNVYIKIWIIILTWKWYYKETDVEGKMLIKKKEIMLSYELSVMSLNGDNLMK